MRVFDCEQGSAEWFRARLGIPTASSFDKIVTPVTGKLSKSSVKYAYRLLAERLLNAPMETIEGQQWMERGKELEPLAANQYEFVNDAQLVRVGFITTDDGLIGASPDRLVKGKAVGVEIKCPAPHTHLGYLLDGHPVEYRPQVQGQLFVAELDRVDFYSYHPRMPPCAISTPRDEPYIKLLIEALNEFNERLFSMLERAKTLGAFQAYEEAATPTEVARAAQLGTALSEEILDAYGIPP